MRRNIASIGITTTDATDHLNETAIVTTVAIASRMIAPRMKTKMDTEPSDRAIPRTTSDIADVNITRTVAANT